MTFVAFGSGVAILLWSLSTLALTLGFRISSSFGETYGPLAGIVALQIWTFVSALSIFYGAAVAAQLEAVRAGTPVPSAAPEPGARYVGDPSRSDR